MKIWKDIKGYEGIYFASNDGEIKSESRIVNGGIYNGRVLKKHTNKSGYQTVALCKDGIPKTKFVHRLIASAFLKPIDDQTQVNHINGIKTDNRVENLEWSTPSENIKHSYRNNLNNKKGEKSQFSKINNNDVLKIRELALEGLNAQKIVNKLKLKIKSRAVSDIINRVNWPHI